MKIYQSLALSITGLVVAASAQEKRSAMPTVGHLLGGQCTIDESVVEKRISAGSSRREVESLLGGPDARFGEEYWIYWNCRVAPGEANPRHYNALLIQFGANQVFELKAVDGTVLRALLESCDKRGAGGRVRN